MFVSRQNTGWFKWGNGDGVVLHVLDVCTHTTVEEGGDEGLSGLGNDVIVEVLVAR